MPGFDFEVTGKVRLVTTGIGGGRVAQTRYSYRCRTCGHEGWSRHETVARLADESGVAPHKDDSWGRERYEKHQKEKD